MNKIYNIYLNIFLSILGIIF